MLFNQGGRGELAIAAAAGAKLEEQRAARGVDLCAGRTGGLVGDGNGWERISGEWRAEEGKTLSNGTLTSNRMESG